MFRYEFTARFRLRSSSYDPTRHSRSQSTQRGKAATKQAFYPQISQITQILKIINKINSKSLGFHDLPSKN